MITIEVTQEDINDGTPYTARHCPISLACMRAFKVREVVTTESEVLVYMEDGIHKYRHTIKKFVEDFDTQKTVQPFTLELYEN